MQTYEKYFKPPNICREKAIFFFLAIVFTRQQHSNELIPTGFITTNTFQDIPRQHRVNEPHGTGSIMSKLYQNNPRQHRINGHHGSGSIMSKLYQKIPHQHRTMGLTAPDLSCPSSIKKNARQHRINGPYGSGSIAQNVLSKIPTPCLGCKGNISCKRFQFFCFYCH